MKPDRKLQRWIDLIAALLTRRYGVSFADLRRLVPGYETGSPAAVRRTFERDKDQLRRLGVPIETRGSESDDEQRYLLAPDAFYLPYLALVSPRGLARSARVDRYGYRALGECEFTDDELHLLADAAARVEAFGDPVMSGDARRALQRLAVDLPPAALSATPGVTVLPPVTAARADVLAQLGDALLRRKQVSFSYHGFARDETERRTVLPYGLAFTSGHWYLHAQDPARGALRRFRVGRITELSVNPRHPGRQDYEIPGDFRLADHAMPVPAWLLGDDPLIEATLRFVTDNGAVQAARRLGTAVDATTVRYSVRRRETFLRWVLSLAGDAIPVAPPDVVREYRELIARTRQSYRGAA